MPVDSCGVCGCEFATKFCGDDESSCKVKDNVGCDSCDQCEECNSGCVHCNGSCQGTNAACKTCDACLSCNTGETECGASRQTPNTSGYFSSNFNNIPSYANTPFTLYNNYFKSVFDTVSAIKNKYTTYNGTKPFSSWTYPSITVNSTNILASQLNNIISNTASQFNSFISEDIMNNLWTNIKDYSYSTDLCASCNTGCNTSCNAGGEQTTQCTSCDSVNYSCGVCNRCLSCQDHVKTPNL